MMHAVKRSYKRNWVTHRQAVQRPHLKVQKVRSLSCCSLQNSPPYPSNIAPCLLIALGQGKQVLATRTPQWMLAYCENVAPLGRRHLIRDCGSLWLPHSMVKPADTDKRDGREQQKQETWGGKSWPAGESAAEPRDVSGGILLDKRRP